MGFLAWLLMVPLALTSTPRSVQRLGFVRWKRLTRWSSLMRGARGWCTSIWRVKKDLTEPLAYAGGGRLAMVRLSAAMAKRRKARVGAS